MGIVIIKLFKAGLIIAHQIILKAAQSFIRMRLTTGIN
jgi:hypothetical protein